MYIERSKRFNPFFPNAPFLYPLKTLENRKFFWCFQGVEKCCIGNKWKLKASNFIKKETPTQKFSGEYCEIFKNTYFEEYLWTDASSK